VWLKGFFFFFFPQNPPPPPVGQGLHIYEVSRSHTTTHHSRYDYSGRVISSSHRPLTDNTQHSQQTSIPPVGFEPTISAGERSQTYALDRAATGTGIWICTCIKSALKLSVRNWTMRVSVPNTLPSCIGMFVRLNVPRLTFQICYCEMSGVCSFRIQSYQR